MSISFPPSPTAGQIYQNWVWNATAGTWDAVSPGLTLQLHYQIFYNSGTYAPSPGLFQADVECLAGGGGGGGETASGGTGCGCGGGAGSYSKRLLTSAQIGASQAVTIGAAGAAGAAGATGGPGGNTSFGSLVTSNGGQGGGTTTTTTATLGLGGAAGVGDLALAGGTGNGGSGGSAGYMNVFPGLGASTLYGSGGPAGFNSAGNAARGYGAGGGGGSVISSGSFAGGAGAPGICIVTEYCWITAAAVAAQAASGARVRLATATVSTAVASVDFPNVFSSTYDVYELEIINANGAAQQPWLRFSPDGGTTWNATATYNYNYQTLPGDGTAGTYTGAVVSALILGQAIYGTAGYPLTANVRFYQPWLTNSRKHCWWEGTYHLQTSGVFTRFWGGGQFGVIAADMAGTLTGVRFMLASGNLTAGTFNVYGIVK